MRVSTRYVPLIALLAMAAAAPVWRAWLWSERADPCAHPDVLSVTGLIPGSVSKGEREEQLGEDVVQWSEGHIVEEGRPREPVLSFRIVRTYNVLKVAERPLHLLAKDAEPERIGLEFVDARGGPLPVHIVRTTGVDAFQLVAYLFVFGNEPVSHPFPSQIRGAWRDLIRGQRPLTVILAGGAATRDNAAQREELALRWIAAAWQHYRTMCLAPSEGQTP